MVCPLVLLNLIYY